MKNEYRVKINKIIYLRCKHWLFIGNKIKYLVVLFEEYKVKLENS